MKTHIDLLGWINVVTGLFWEVFGLFVLVSLFLLAPTTGDSTGSMAVVVIALTLSGRLLSLGIPALVAGTGLLKRKSWARTWVLIAGILAFPMFPIGTLVAFYAFWTLTKDESSDLLKTTA